MEHEAIGRQLRARRTAAGRTVASVAAEAGLSVPYVANLENGRGNPTATALTRLADALGTRLLITLAPDDDGRQTGEPAPPEVPASLVRLGRTVRYRQAVTAMAAALGLDSDELSARLVAGLAALAHATGRDLTEPDWWRLLDALMLIAAHPAASLPAILDAAAAPSGTSSSGRPTVPRPMAWTPRTRCTRCAAWPTHRCPGEPGHRPCPALRRKAMAAEAA